MRRIRLEISTRLEEKRGKGKKRGEGKEKKKGGEVNLFFSSESGIVADEREDDERRHSVTDSSGMTYGKGDTHPRGSKVRDDGIQPRRFPRKLFAACRRSRQQLRERSPTGCACFRLGQYCIGSGGGGGGGGGGRLPSINFISE